MHKSKFAHLHTYIYDGNVSKSASHAFTNTITFKSLNTYRTMMPKPSCSIKFNSSPSQMHLDKRFSSKLMKTMTPTLIFESRPIQLQPSRHLRKPTDSLQTQQQQTHSPQAVHIKARITCHINKQRRAIISSNSLENKVGKCSHIQLIGKHSALLDTYSRNN